MCLGEISALIFLGVRQRTVRQMSTMDNAGTLPIYVYNNTATEEYDAVLPATSTLHLHMNDHPDDIEHLPEANPSTSRAGRARKQPVRNDMVLY